MKSRKSKTFLLLLSLLVLVSFFVRSETLTSRALVTTTYQIPAPITEELRLVQLTDLHNTEFGDENCDLIMLVADQKPDLILITGDMLNRDEEDVSVITALLPRLADIAPVYYGLGNHEVSWEKTFGRDITKVLENAGAAVLEAEYIDLEFKGQQIRLGGLMAYYRQPGIMRTTQGANERQFRFAAEFEDTDRYKILLNHIPTPWVDWGYNNLYPVNLVLSGHYHGGMIYFPLLERGLYAPYVGWFPENVRGVFEGEKATCVLSAGLGSEYPLPRIHNNPELVVVDLIPEGQD